jgi:phosphatidylglycerol---prolipoprotein diacylglyceryl transferase
MWRFIGTIPVYSIFYSLGILIHFVISWRLARRLGLRPLVGITVSFNYMLGMTVGAKILYDIFYGDFNPAALLQIKHYFQGGLWGGLLAYPVLAVPGVFMFARRKREALDLVALTVPIPWIISKIGCLMNGCCYGRPCHGPWSITFPEGAAGAPAYVAVHPTQLYEMLVMAVLLVVFLRLDRNRWTGTMLLWFLVVYGFGRVLTDFFRGDLQDRMPIGPFSAAQIVCAIVAGISTILLCLWARRKKPQNSFPNNL